MPTWLAVTLATVAVFALLWIGGEEHYQSCVAHSAVKVKGYAFGGNAVYPGAATNVNARLTRGGGCSRLPW